MSVSVVVVCVWVGGWEVGASFLCSRSVTEATGKEMKVPHRSWIFFAGHLRWCVQMCRELSATRLALQLLVAVEWPLHELRAFCVCFRASCLLVRCWCCVFLICVPSTALSWLSVQASFAGDVPRMFSLIKNEGDSRHLRYRRGLNHKPCRLEIGGRMFVGSGRAPPGVASVALFDTAREKLTWFGHSKDGQIDSSFLTGA